MVPDIAAVFELNGERLRVEYRRLPLVAWKELKAQTGLTPRTLMDAVAEFDVDALIALVWLERKTRERRLTLQEVTAELEQGFGEVEMEVVDFLIGGRSLYGDEPQEVAEDPTTSGGS